MKDKFRKLSESYVEGVKSAETWSRIPIESIYTPKDTAHIDYEKSTGNPGQYPFTRGIHPDMYKGRFWTRRELYGYGTPTDTNQKLKYLAAEGQGGLNFINDLPTALGIDPDHPPAIGGIGVAGVADPLGGSYYIENLTETIEEKATEIIDEIDAMGVITSAIESQWLDREIEKASNKF